MLILKDLSKVYKGNGIPVPALCRVNFTVEEGESVVVIGPNGSGKTTLLQVIMGSTALDDGAIILGGENVSSWSESKRSRHIAMVGQRPGDRMATSLSIIENLALITQRSQPVWWRAITAKRRDFFRLFLGSLGLGLEARLDSPLSDLSAGQLQTLTVAAWAGGLVTPKVLLLDEHCASLDAKMASHVMGITDRVCKDGKVATIMVTHNFEHAAQFGERLVFLHGGRLAWEIWGDAKKSLTAAMIFKKFHELQASLNAGPGSEFTAFTS